MAVDFRLRPIVIRDIAARRILWADAYIPQLGGRMRLSSRLGFSVFAGVDRRERAPGKGDPTIRAFPHVFAPEDCSRLLVEHRRLNFAGVLLADLVDKFEGASGVGDVVDDENFLARHAVIVGNGVDQARIEKGGSDSRVELDVEDEQTLDVQSVPDGTGGKEASPGHAYDDVGAKSRIPYGSGQLAASFPEIIPGEYLALISHGLIMPFRACPVGVFRSGEPLRKRRQNVRSIEP